jgi:hypothetical protein
MQCVVILIHAELFTAKTIGVLARFTLIVFFFFPLSLFFRSRSSSFLFFLSLIARQWACL